MKTVIAFGAGSYYQNNREKIDKEYDIVAFCDNAPEKIGAIFFGKPIISVDNINEYGDEIEILITTPTPRYRYEIIAQLIELGIHANRIQIIQSWWMEGCCTSVRVVETGLEVCISGIKMLLTNAVEEMICREIWYGDDYNVNLPSDSVVIDIGMNVGYATLFFANKSFVKKIYAFEPDLDVYEKAVKHIEMNEHIANKVVSYNLACSDCNKEEVYVIDERKSAGIHIAGENEKDSLTKVVKCVDASEVIGNIVKEHYGKNRIVMKCDCEGAEYEIFSRLEETGLFEKIDVFVMEWHLGRRTEIEMLFARNNYTYHIFTTPGRDFGKCFAFKCER